jgi:type I restriction enzyme R subunit
LENRSIFHRLLAPLITTAEKDRAIDLTGVKLSHYSLKAEDVEDLRYGDEADPLRPFSAAGSGTAKDPDFVRLRELIDKMNTLFEGDGLTDNDMVGFTVYVGGKFDENERLREQAKANRFEQFP